MSGVLSPSHALRASRGLVLAASLFVLWAASLFFRTPAASAWPEVEPHGAAPAPAALAGPSDAELQRAVATDLFSPDRSAPAVRYRIERASATPNAPPPLPVRLVGTVVTAAGRSFAMCQQGAATPRVVYPGQHIGPLKLESVSQGSATFTDDAGVRVVLRVAKAGS